MMPPAELLALALVERRAYELHGPRRSWYWRDPYPLLEAMHGARRLKLDEEIVIRARDRGINAARQRAAVGS